MTHYHYTFNGDVSLDLVEKQIDSVVETVRTLHGEAATRLDLDICQLKDPRIWLIEGATDVGRDLNRLIVDRLNCAIGEDGYVVRRIDAMPFANPFQALSDRFAVPQND